MSLIDIQQLQHKAIAELICLGQKVLISVSDSAKLDIEVLLCFVLKKPRSYLLTWPDTRLEQVQLEQLVTLLNRRICGEPIAYITGQREFWSLLFYVSPATLIPRPDTECLVEQVITDHSSEQLRCLDLGTGTGAIALALASEHAHWQIDAVDYSLDAVNLAKRNAQALDLKQVNIYQSHWFSQVPAQKKFDVIVSNPPYIDEKDHHLTEGDVRFEPKSALVAQENGLADIRFIAENAIQYFDQTGYLYLEHGFEQAGDVKGILVALGYHQVCTHKDYNHNDRFTSACFSK